MAHEITRIKKEMFKVGNLEFFNEHDAMWYVISNYTDKILDKSDSILEEDSKVSSMELTELIFNNREEYKQIESYYDILIKAKYNRLSYKNPIVNK